MKPPLLYLLETLFCSGLLLAFYRLLLVRRIPFAWCRGYLLAAVLLSALLPALEIPVYPARTVMLVGVEIAAEPAEAEPSATPAAESAPAGERMQGIRRGVLGLSLLPTAVLAGLLTARIVSIRRLRSRARLTRRREYTLAEHPSVETPFSFLRTIFLGDGCGGRRREIVLLHEASHVRHRHSAERLAIEIVRCLFWFNPFVWMAGRWLAEVHEWEADRDVLDAGCDLTEYRTLLFCQLFGYNPDIACGLNHSLTKKRFAMMTKFQKRRFAALRLGAALPVVAGMAMLCSFTVREAAAEEPAATIRIADGAVYMNGEHRSIEELRTFVAAEREQLCESGRARLGDNRDNDRTQPTIHVATDGSVRLNGEQTTRDELERRLARLREELSNEEAARTVVRISADTHTPVQYLTEVKQALRRAKMLRVEYLDEQQQTARILPPAPNGEAGGVRIAERISADNAAGSDGVRIKAQNLFLVQVNEGGEILAGNPNSLELIAAEALPARIEEFVLDGSKQTAADFTRSDGSAVNWPVSQGVVSLTMGSKTPYEKYVAVQRLVEQGFLQARNARAEQLTGVPYERLDAADQELFKRVVPLKLFETEPHP